MRFFLCSYWFQNWFHFFTVLVTIEPGRSLLQFVTTNCLKDSSSDGNDIWLSEWILKPVGIKHHIKFLNGKFPLPFHFNTNTIIWASNRVASWSFSRGWFKQVFFSGVGTFKQKTPQKRITLLYNHFCCVLTSQPNTWRGGETPKPPFGKSPGIRWVPVLIRT